MLIMVIGLIGPVGFVSEQRLAIAHPLLLQLAAESPELLVAVIVQEMAIDTHLQALVVQLGGVVTKDLSIINAFAAELEAADALTLAQDPGVRWVSLDAPVERSGKLGSDCLLHATNRQLSYYHKPSGTTYTFPYLDVYATVTGTTTTSANNSQTASQLLWCCSDPVTWGSVGWNSVAWNE